MAVATRFTKESKKYLVALGGIGLLLAVNSLGITIPGVSELVTNIIIGLLVSEGVYQVSNSVKGTQQEEVIEAVEAIVEATDADSVVVDVSGVKK